nr:hypothetical protein [Brevundimonas naejangsanensis]
MTDVYTPSAASTEVALREVDGEPRVRDLDLAEKLGFKRPRVIRELIERNMGEIENFGAVRHGVNKIRSGRGRVTEVEEFYLNEEQALLVSVLSNAPNAAAVRAMLIRVFVAYRRGELEAKAPKANPALIGREARLQFRMGLSVARMLGLTGNQAALSANGLALRTTGVDVLEAMGQKRLAAPQQEVLLTATDIGRELGGKSAISVNSMLEAFGFQVGGRDHKHRTYWEPTALGLRAGAVMLDVERANKSGNSRQLRWASSIIDVLRELEAA